MSLLVKRQQLLIKSEAVEGTPIGGDIFGGEYILAEGVSFKPDIEMLDRNFRRASLDPLSKISGKRKGELTFSTVVKGSGAAGDFYAPFGDILKAAGMTEAHVASPHSVTYTPRSAVVTDWSSPAQTLTAFFELDGVSKILSGCVANVKFKLKSGQIPMMDVSLKGVYNTPTDQAFPAPAYSAVPDPIVQSSAFSFDGVTSFVVDSFEIDFGNEVVERPNVRSAAGLGGFLLAGRNPVGSMDPELTLVAAYNFLAKQQAAVPGILSFVVGSGTGQVNTFSMPKAQITGVDLGERNGIAIANCKLAFAADAGDDWFSLTQSS
jgi:hypothetical protein